MRSWLENEEVGLHNAGACGRIFTCNCLVKVGLAILRQAERTRQPARIVFPNKEKRRDPRLNGRIGVEISRRPKHRKPVLNKGRESRAGNCDQGDQERRWCGCRPRQAKDREQSGT